MISWLIVGLGNPGDKYARTRHNSGFMVVDTLARQMALNWKPSKFHADIAENGRNCLVKPQTFMNLSGIAVSEMARYYKIPSDQVIVVHDDLDIPLGSIKVGFGKGPKQHNGLLSIEQLLGTKDFWRIRVGIENRIPEERKVIPGQVYVLKPMVESEQQIMEAGIQQAVQRVAEIIKKKPC